MNPFCEKCNKDLEKTSFGYLCLECGNMDLFLGKEEIAEKFIENMRTRFKKNKKLSWKAGNTFYHQSKTNNL